MTLAAFRLTGMGWACLELEALSCLVQCVAPWPVYDSESET